MSNHTTGPWKVYEADSDTMHIGTVSTEPGAGWKYETVCHLYEDVADNYDTNNEFKLFDNAEANARLIAAAPEMLELLAEYLAFNGDWAASMPEDAWVEKVRAVVAKAT